MASGILQAWTLAKRNLLLLAVYKFSIIHSVYAQQARTIYNCQHRCYLISVKQLTVTTF